MASGCPQKKPDPNAWIAAWKVDQKDPKERARSLMGRGRERQNRGDDTGAVSDYSHALKADPSLVRAWHFRAKVFYRNEMYADAESDLSEAIKRTSSERLKHTFLVDRATVREAAGNLKGAVEDLETAVELKPEGGSDQEKKKRGDQARQRLKEARARLAR